MPRPRKEIDSPNEYIGADSEFDIDEIGDKTIEVVDRPLSMHKAEMEQFMAEMVTVMIHDTTDKNASPIVQLGVNGRTQMMIRGQPQKIKRCYLERLARAKETGYSQDLDRMDEGFNRVRTHNALSYPFSVINDPNPKGADWLRGILAEQN